MERRSTRSLLWAGLLMGTVACGTDDSTKGGGKDDGGDDSGADLHTSKTGLLRATSCEDLLTKIQNDAIAKLDLTIERIKNHPESYYDPRDPGPWEGPVDEGEPAPGAPGEGDSAGDADGAAGGDGDGDGDGSGNGGGGPTGSSDTNTQVEGVDEADFVKVVKKGAAMFVLHGNKLLKLKSWPAAATALEGEGLEIEGYPSEMFVNDTGKAVVFSAVYGYETNGRKGGGDYVCSPYACATSSYTKITIADVSGAVPKTERELYYEGSYVSSRRYESASANVVRVVLQGYPRSYDIYSPVFSTSDAFGNAYDKDEIAEQLDAWRDRMARDVRSSTLEDWMPTAREAKGDALVEVPRDCTNHYVPQPGLSDFGLTHVLSLDVSKPDAAVGGVTIMGATSAVYSNAETMLLAQPDYRAARGDFGFVDQQQTALHVFELSGESTAYKASGFVPGMLAGNIPQFALDVEGDVVRAATTGWERVNPDAAEFSDEWWSTHPVNRVVTAKAEGSELKVVDELSPLGHEGETIRSSRFLGDRGYIVTFRNTDPLIVVDLSKPEDLKNLGEIEIPGFSEYMHPLDANHLVTLGQSGSLWGLQLQIFDVSDPTSPKQKHVLDLGDGTSSEASFEHKAFTYYADKKLLALPVYDYGRDSGVFSSGLSVMRVDAASGFDVLGRVDHSSLIQQQTCGYCDAWGDCWDDGGSCYSYYPEVRRGHFVTGEDDATYVYSFSYGGVLVNDVADLGEPVASVALPSVVWSEESWYGRDDTSGGGGRPDSPGDGDVEPGDGDGDGDGDVAPAQDGGVPAPVQDAGAPEDFEDAGVGLGG